MSKTKKELRDSSVEFSDQVGGRCAVAGGHGEGEAGVGSRPEAPVARWSERVGGGDGHWVVFRGGGGGRETGGGEVEGDPGEGGGDGDAGGLAPGLLEGPGTQEGRRALGWREGEEGSDLRVEEVPSGDGFRSGLPVETLHIHTEAVGSVAGGGDDEASGVGDADGDGSPRGVGPILGAARCVQGVWRGGRAGVGGAAGGRAGNYALRGDPQQLGGEEAQESPADAGAPASFAVAADCGAPVVGRAEQHGERLVGLGAVRDSEQP